MWVFLFVENFLKSDFHFKEINELLLHNLSAPFQKQELKQIFGNITSIIELSVSNTHIN